VGAGRYEFEWLQRRTVPGKVRDAHSLYLETLAELGVTGLLLLSAALVAPLLAIRRARHRRLAPFAIGAYVALLAHAGVDWDWELPVLMVTGLVLAAVAVVAGRPEDSPPAPTALRWGLAGLAVLLGAFSFLGLLGNEALADSRRAARDGRWQASASHARDAAHWAPWSAEAWRRVALAQGSAKAARPLFLKAIEKDPRNWELRLELAWASKGAARTQALRDASRLNPFSPEVAAYRRQLAEERKAAG
jgi:O-antigen ligase